jgi:hypothetical protein
MGSWFISFSLGSNRGLEGAGLGTPSHAGNLPDIRGGLIPFAMIFPLTGAPH